MKNNRKFLSHDFRSFVRTNREDLISLARVVSDRLSGLKRPPTIVVPLKGWSKADSPGAPFYDPELDLAFVSELRARLETGVRIVEVDANINDEQCAQEAVSLLHELMNQDGSTR